MEDNNEMAKKIRVFVYGTLKQGFGNHVVLEDCTFLGRATISGKYRLVDMGWYPGAAKMGDDHPDGEVGGEVYEIDHDTLATLDMIEGHPTYYCREKVPTSLGYKAWVYLLPKEYGARSMVNTLFWRQSETEEAWARERKTA